MCGDSYELSLLRSDVKRLTPVCVPAERYVEVTIIHILEPGTYKVRKWGSLPHTMLRENAEFSMPNWHQILLLSASFTDCGNFYRVALVSFYLVIRLMVTKKNGSCFEITFVLFDCIHPVLNR